MRKFRVGVLMAFLLACSVVYGQGLVSNGDFESWTDGSPDDWSPQGGVVLTKAVGLDGAGFSVNLGKTGSSTGHALSQVLSSSLSGSFYVQYDFAFGDPGADRAMDVTLKSGGTSRVHPRVNAGRIEFYDQEDSWQIVSGTEGMLVPSNFATGSLVVYRIIIEGMWEAPYYVSVKNLTTDADIVTDVEMNAYQSTSGSTFTQMYFERGRSGADWRVDNVMVFAADPTVPSVDAGANQQVMAPANTVTMSPSVFDVDTDPAELVYLWEAVSGPASSFSAVEGETENDAQAVITLEGGPGIYEFKVTVSDPDEHSGEDTVLVRVKDSSDNVLLGHWAFEDDPAGTIAVDSLNEALGNVAADDGVLVALPAAADPNNDPNWVSGWVGDGGLQFWDQSAVSIAMNGGTDPNLMNLQWEISAAAWVKPDPDSPNENTFIGRGAPFNWTLRRDQTGAAEFTVALESGTLFTIGTTTLDDGYWHHVVGTYDGKEVKIFVDGVLDVSQEAGSLLKLSPESDLNIGNRSDYGDQAYYGLIDDVRVYSYALSGEEIAGLVQLGQNAIPSVTIDEEVPTDTIIGFPEWIDLTAQVIDLNQEQGQEISAEWTVTDPQLAEFVAIDVDGPEWPNAAVKFLQSGIYTLRLTVSDGIAGLDGDIYDEITIVVNDATCENMLVLDPQSGELVNPDLSFDVSGPEGVPDCYVNMHDLAKFAQQWMLCNDPGGQGCGVGLP